MIRTVLITFFLTMVLSVSTFACGMPQIVSGRVFRAIGSRNVPISKARVVITVKPKNETLVYSAITNSFGFYRIVNVMPCQEYEITVSAKGVDSQKQSLYVVGDADGYLINFYLTRFVTYRVTKRVE